MCECSALRWATHKSRTAIIHQHKHFARCHRVAKAQDYSHYYHQRILNLKGHTPKLDLWAGDLDPQSSHEDYNAERNVDTSTAGTKPLSSMAACRMSVSSGCWRWAGLRIAAARTFCSRCGIKVVSGASMPAMSTSLSCITNSDTDYCDSGEPSHAICLPLNIVPCIFLLSHLRG